MFEREGKTVLYLESAVKQKSLTRNKGKAGAEGAASIPLPSDQSRHTVIDVVPVREKDLKAVMSYFREVHVFFTVAIQTKFSVILMMLLVL